MQKLKAIIQKEFNNWWYLYLFLIIYFIAITLLNLNRFWQFENFYFDHGIFDQSLWNASRFKLPYIDHLESKPLLQLGDHFNPSIYLLVPFYWVFNSYELLFILGNIFVVLSAFVMFLVARLKIKNKSIIFSLILAYCLFLGLVNGLIAGFHPEIFGLFILSLVFYFLEKNNWKMFWVFLFIFIGLKEVFVGLVFGLGILLITKKEFKKGVFLLIFSVIYYLTVVKFVIPSLAGQAYGYEMSDIKIVEIVRNFFLPIEKTKTIFTSLLNFGLLPVFNLNSLPLIIQDYLIRYSLDSDAGNIDLGMHYNLIVSILLLYSSISSVSKIEKSKKLSKYLNIYSVLIIFIVFYLNQFKFKSPLKMVLNPVFYQSTRNSDFLRNFLNEIPRAKLVMTTNSLATYMTHDYEIILLREDYWRHMPDIIAIDFRSGQNPNNYWPLTSLESIKMRLENDPNYIKIEVYEKQIYFEKKKNIDTSYYLEFKEKAE